MTSGVRTAAAPKERTHGSEHVGRGYARRTDALQLGREHIEQHLGIGRRIEVTTLFADEHVGKLCGVREVPIVAEHDAVRRIHVERLRLGDVIAAGGRVAHVTDADVAAQLEHVLLTEDIAHEALPLAHADETVDGGHDPCGVLPAMLQHRQRVVETLIDRAFTDDTCNAAHGFASRNLGGGARAPENTLITE
jgi:hypothetical protein